MEIDALRQKRGYAANNFQTDLYDKGRVDRALAEEMSEGEGETTASAPNRRDRRILELRNEQKTLAAARR